MAEFIEEVMIRNPTALSATMTIGDAARTMREHDIARRHQRGSRQYVSYSTIRFRSCRRADMAEQPEPDLPPDPFPPVDPPLPEPPPEPPFPDPEPVAPPPMPEPV